MSTCFKVSYRGHDFPPGYLTFSFFHMQLKLFFISALLISFDLVKASEKRRKIGGGKHQEQAEMKENAIPEGLDSDNESFTTEEACSSRGKRDASVLSSSSPPMEMPRSCIKDTTTGSDTNRLITRRVSFHPDVLAETTFPIRGEKAERTYLQAIFDRKFNFAEQIRKQGLMLSGSNTTFMYINKLLRTKSDMTPFLFYLIKYQPHVFDQIYDNGENVFFNATQSNVDFIMERLPNANGIMVLIFREALRTPSLILNDNFFIYMRANRIWEMIDLAEATDRFDLIRKCYLLPEYLDFYNLDGENILTDAIKHKNITRIRWLLSRRDAASFMLQENMVGKNSFDVAMEMHDKGHDSSYSLMLILLLVIRTSYKTHSITEISDVLREFTEHAREADDREILLTALRRELEYSRNYAIADVDTGKEENDENDEKLAYKTEFINLIDSYLLEVSSISEEEEH